jgi:hypothetical protein
MYFFGQKGKEKKLKNFFCPPTYPILFKNISNNTGIVFLVPYGTGRLTVESDFMLPPV